jgi:hypothetical protein
MKILILSVSPRGNICATRIPLKNAEAMSSLGHDVAVLFGRQVEIPSNINCSSFQVVFTPAWIERFVSMPNGFGLGEMLFRSWYVLRNRFDVIHTCPGHRPSLLIPCILAKWIKKTVIVDEWWEWFGKGGCAENRQGLVQKLVGAYDAFMELKSKRIYNLVVAISSSLKERIPRHPNCMVLYGASESEEMVAYSKEDAREPLGISSDHFLVGMSNVDAGDHDDNLPFFSAFSMLCDTCENARLFLTGDAEYIRDVVMNIIPADKIITVGWLEFCDYNRYLSACDLFFIPFPPTLRNKGRWPNKLGDFISLKRPVVSNPSGDVKKVVSQYNIGFLCANHEDEYLQLTREIIADPGRVASENFGFDAAIAAIPGFSGRVERLCSAYAACLYSKSTKRNEMKGTSK